MRDKARTHQAIRLNDGYVRWLRRQAGSRIKRAIIGRMYRDRYPDYEHSALVAGMARSGTTWVGDIIGSQGSNRFMFEPFNPAPVGALKSSTYIQYHRPQDQDPALLAFCERVFSGRIRHPWIDRQVERLYPKYRLVKAVRANLMLKWLHLNFPQVAIILLVRHPCAVVASWMKLGWTAERDWNSFMIQPQLKEDFLAKRWSIIEAATREEERIAVAWCVNYLVPFQQLQSGEAHVVFYEDLVNDPETQIPLLFKALGRPYTDSVFRAALEPSVTSQWSSAVSIRENRLARWRDFLSGRQIERINAVVAGFGLDYLYGDGSTPSTNLMGAPVDTAIKY